MAMSSLRLHATAVAMGRVAVLFRGPSGAGKSDLALRLIDAGRAVLIADDQTIVTAIDGRLVASAPPAIAGNLEIRGLGIIPNETAPPTQVGLLVDLTDAANIDRMPEPERLTETLLGVPVPRISLDPAAASAVARLAASLRHLAPGYESGPLGLVATGKR